MSSKIVYQQTLERTEKLRATSKATGVPLVTAVQGPSRFSVLEILGGLADLCPAGVDLEVVLTQLLDYVQNFKANVTSGSSGLTTWQNQRLK